MLPPIGNSLDIKVTAAQVPSQYEEISSPYQHRSLNFDLQLAGYMDEIKLHSLQYKGLTHRDSTRFYCRLMHILKHFSTPREEVLQKLYAALCVTLRKVT